MRRLIYIADGCWAGRLQFGAGVVFPLISEDFAPTQGRPGWPIAFADFDPYVADALDFFDAGIPDFSAASSFSIEDPSLPVTADLVLDRIERYSKPTNVWRKWSAQLTRAQDITVIYGVTCTSVLTNPAGSAAAGLELKTPSGTRHTIAAETIVLACGGLETPRLLLASRATRSCGVGNERDLVGRFYMTHLVSSAENVGALRFAAVDRARAFDFKKTKDGVYGRRMILLAPEARRRGNLPNIVFRPGRPPIDDPSHHDPVLSAMFMVRNKLIPPEYARGLIANGDGSLALQTWTKHGQNIVRGLPPLFRFGVNWVTRRILATRKLPSVFLYRKDGKYPLEFNAEQLPNFDSRVMLGNDTDSLGMPRLVVRWKFLDSELDAICRAYRVLASAVAQSGLGEVDLDPDLSRSVSRALVAQGGHNIGTVRMGSDASVGVIDTNCEVWSTRGLFIAGTAVLPTSGFANPTLTAVALAFRLAEHLVRRQKQPAANRDAAVQKN